MSRQSIFLSEQEVIFGSLPILNNGQVLGFFSEEDILFLDALGQEIRRIDATGQYSDLAAFAFWSRAANLRLKKKRYSESGLRVGRGVVVHITPGNVPTNFLYSLSFGLLSGNYNIVRLPSRDFDQIRIVIQALLGFKARGYFADYLKRICFVRYEKSDEKTTDLFHRADHVVIWGSNNTIETLRQLKKPNSCGELLFIEKNSSCFLNARYIEELKKENIKAYRVFLKRFYSDSFLFDQNGCSSPKSVYWIWGESYRATIDAFWEDLANIVEVNYHFNEGIAIKKFSELCEYLSTVKYEVKVRELNNFVYVMESFDSGFYETEQNLRYGTFKQHISSSLSEAISHLSKSTQTVTYFGFMRDELANSINEYFPLGLDRLVPVGEAFTMDLIWDGIDTLLSLSKRIVIN